MRFLAQANLNQIIRREERNVDAGDARAELNDRIRHIFNGAAFDAIHFPGGPFDVPDEVGDGRPKLIVLSYDAVAIDSVVSKVPDLIERIYTRKGSEGTALRVLRNHLAFVAADEHGRAEMQRRARLRLALRALRRPDRLTDLAEHQQDQVREFEARSEQELAIAIQQAYRHLFFPSRDRVDIAGADLQHTAIEIQSAADQPGAGQRHIARALRDLKKLRLREDEPDAPAYVRDRTPLKKGQMTTLALRDEFRRDPALPMLMGDDIFIRGIRRGVERGDYVYQRGDLLFGPGDPPAAIMIGEQALVLTMAYAKNTGVWPRPEAKGAEDSGKTEPDKPPIEKPSKIKQTRPGFEIEGTGEDGGAGQFQAEGVLREALVQLWEQARSKNAGKIERLRIRLFEAADAFRLLNVVGAISEATKAVTIEGGYETQDGGSFVLNFSGPVADAQPVREFLEPQLRAASAADLQAAFALTFPDGLPMQGDAAEKLTERLCKFASGAAFVSATAEAKA